MAEDVQKHVRTYLLVFGALLVLTVVTVGVAQLHLAEVERVVVALVIASFKAVLVAGIFMHLFGLRGRPIFVVLGITGTFFLVLLILTLSSASDSFRILG